MVGVSIASLQKEMAIARVVKLKDRNKPIVEGDLVVASSNVGR